MKVIKIKNSAGSGECVLNASSLDGAYLEIQGLMEGGESGDFLTITLAEMPDDEFEALPEFDGW